MKSLPTYVWPYLYAKLPQHTGTLSKAVPHDLVDDVIKVVGTEGPVHVDLVYERIGAAWNVSRLTAKVKQLINTAIGIAVHDRRIEQRGDFLWPIGLATPIVRAPKDGDKARSIEHIAPEEIAEAAFLVAQEARSLSEADLICADGEAAGLCARDQEDRCGGDSASGLKTSSRIVEAEGRCAWREDEMPEVFVARPGVEPRLVRAKRGGVCASRNDRKIFPEVYLRESFARVLPPTSESERDARSTPPTPSAPSA